MPKHSVWTQMGGSLLSKIFSHELIIQRSQVWLFEDYIERHM